MNHTERMIAQRPAPGYYDHDMAGELGVVGHWALLPEFNGSAHRAGYTAYDQSGNDRHGTLTNMDPPTDWGPQGLEFDGSNDYVDVGDIRELNSASAFTVGAWFRQDVLDKYDVLWAKMTDGAHFLQGWTYVDGNLYFHVCNGRTDSAGYWDYSSTISAGMWHYLTFGFDGSGATDAAKMQLYVDGVSQSLLFSAAIPATTADMSGKPFTIGRSTASLDGSIAQVCIHNRALTAQQVADSYAEPFNLFQRPTRSYFWVSRGGLMFKGTTLGNDRCLRGLIHVA